MTAHARVGPSSLSRVLRCPGSVRESEGLSNTSSIFAAEGSVLHDIAAQCLEDGVEPESFFGRTMRHDGYSFVIGTQPGETDPTCITMALDWLREQPGEMFVETKVDLDPWMPEQFGTCDVCIWDADDEIATVFDWKFGMGVMVDVVGNEQLRAYALGALHTILRPRGIEPKIIRIIIEQPRGAGGARFWEPWEITLEELLDFGETLKGSWLIITSPDAPLCAGKKQCVDGFCLVKDRPPQQPGDLTGCRTYDDFMAAILDAKFEDMDEMIDLDLPANLTGSRRWFIVRHASMLEKWLAKLHEDSIAAAEAGNPDPGSKMIDGRRGARDWVEDPIMEVVIEDRLKRHLGDNAYVRKVKSPAQAEKDLATKRGKKAHPGVWDGLSDLIIQGEAKPILVSEDDPRPARKSVDDKFDEDDSDDDLINLFP